VPVTGLSGVSAIAAGGQHSLALLGNGTAMAWGEDKWGELGDGQFDSTSDVPVAVSGLGEIAGIGAGSLQGLAYGEPIPSVASVSPANGSLKGGTSVTITGIEFTEVSAVSFGGVPAASYTVNGPTSITAVSPAHAVGTVDVTVTNSAGTSGGTPADHFTYSQPPAVTKLSPKAGSGKGGTTVTITGERFTGATAVKFGSTPAASFKVKSATSITAVTPAEAAGTVSVTVTTPNGTSVPGPKAKFKFKK